MKCMLKMSSFGTINIMLGSCNLHKFPLKTTSKKTSMHQNKNKYSMTFFLLAFTHSYKFFNDRIKISTGFTLWLLRQGLTVWLWPA